MKEIIIIPAFIGVLIGLFLLFGGGLSKSSNILLVPTLKGDTGAQGPAGPSGSTADFSNVAKVNQSNGFTANNTFGTVIVNGWLNVSNSSTLGNTTATFLNVSQQFFIGENRSVFPFSCPVGQFANVIGTNGLITCSSVTDVDPSTDFSNIAYVNQSNTFTNTNTFKNVFFQGLLNSSNSSTLGNVSIEKLWSNLIPFTDLAWNLGSSALRWSDSYSSNFWGNSFNGTWINATYINSTNDVNTSRLFVGNNRSAFPISCPGTNKISSLDANGFLTCTADQTGSTDFSKVAYVNQSNGFTANNTFQNLGISGWLNVSNDTTLGNTTATFFNVSQKLYVGENRSIFPLTCANGQFASAIGTNGLITCSTVTTDFSNIAYLNQSNLFTNINNFKSMVDIDSILNVSNSTTLGNGTATFWNISNQLFVGDNRSAFPVTCSGTNKFSALNPSTGLFTCSSDPTFDNTNECLLNATQTFTNVNTLSNTWNFNGFLNVSNSTSLGNTTVRGDFNVSNLTVLGTTFINNYPAMSLIFINDTKDVLTGNQSFKSFTLPANNFSRIIIQGEYEIDGASGSLYSWTLEFRNSTAIWKDVNFTDSALTGLQTRFGGLYQASAQQTLSSKLNVTFFPITKGSAIVGIQGLTIYGVS